MQLLKNLPPKYINGRCVSYAIFWCDFCKSEVIKRLGDGKRYKSCGCMGSKFIIKHGQSYTKLHKVWCSMKRRCSNQKDKGYKNYGGRGITVCNEWLEFIPFRNWSLANGYQEGLEIDRIDNNGNYEPSNCQFVKKIKNARNKRNIKLSIEIANEIRRLYNTGYYTQQQLGDKYNLRQGTITKVVNFKLWKLNV